MIVRFVDRHFLIIDAEMRTSYLRLLARAMTESDWKCFGYCLMGNHIHLAMLAGETPLDRWMRRVHPPFAAAINKRLDRIGPVFAASPTLWAAHRGEELRVVAYIHNNPVRAGEVARARDSTWSSHQAYLGISPAPWVASELALEMFGLDADQFDNMVDQSVEHRLEPSPVPRVRRGARRIGAVEVATPVGPAVVHVPLVARRWTHFRPTPVIVLQVAGEVLGVPVERMRAQGGATIARIVAMQCGRALGVSLAAMAASIGISAQSASRLALRALSPEDAAAARVITGRIEREISDAVEEMSRASAPRKRRG